MATDPTNIYKQALEELEKIIANPYLIDREYNHRRADTIICALLRTRGHNDIVDAYDQIEKYYS